ncbi:hypothetical protein AZE42_09012 [Rhizopogon vesiculosus]|uniref:Uncharacterized protein n=1 Tax=Rhizopogon vesiculosus TaxID=180088 RepID=A0A1J8Q3D5_9AGAM|nr:hypothetical protein AZE42_09012 [Rhizopogon vesiculosus]
MLDLVELRLHLRDDYMWRGCVKYRLRRSRHIIPDPLPIQHRDTSASSNEITPEKSEILTWTQSELDDVDDSMIFTSTFEQITLQQLFNLSDNAWTNLTERIGTRSLDDELEFYELVELDAEGEVDDPAFDDMMSSTVLLCAIRISVHKMDSES